MKKILSLIITVCLLISTFVSASAAEHFVGELVYDGSVHSYKGAHFTLIIDGKQIQSPIPPVVLENGRSIVTARECFEAMDADVLWTQGSPSRILISNDNTVVSLALDDNTAYINGTAVEMEAPAKLVGYNDVYKTMIPVRFVAQALGMEVNYIKDTDTISISAPTPTPTPTPTPDVKYISDIEYSANDTAFTMTVSLDSPYEKYTHFTLDDPLRIVLDINNFSAASLNPTYQANTFISRIRTADYYGNARLVLDTNGFSDYSITASDDKRTITLTVYPSATEPEAPVSPFGDYKIVIDAGHGGSDPGAIGYNDDGSISLKESSVTLPIANRVYQILKDNGINAYYTRNTDVYVTLDERTSFANKIGASLFVSIHCNAFTTTDVKGSLVMHHTSKDTSAYGVSGKELAENILKYLPSALGTNNRGRVDGSAMYVIRKADMPSVIVETAFITNASDRSKLADTAYREKAAQAIAQGIMDTIPNLKK